MHRRNFLALSIAAGMASAIQVKAQPLANKLLAPTLKKGSRIGIVAPGTAVSDPEDIFRAKEAAEYFGLEPVLSDHLLSGSGYKTRATEERIDDIHAMFADDTIEGIFAIRGGYGSARLLDKLDYGLIADNPKIFLGYSDITALHTAIHQQTGLVTFHGPVMLSSFSEYTAEHLQKMIFGSDENLILKNPKEMSGIRESYPTMAISPGTAEGELAGGNLTIISTTMGTPYEIETAGKIFFIEDVGEKAYSIDRMLTQLRLAGKFDNVAGVIFGKCAECEASPGLWDPDVAEVAFNLLSDLECPVLYGLLIGHTENQITLPIGIKAKLDADAGTVELLERWVK